MFKKHQNKILPIDSEKHKELLNIAGYNSNEHPIMEELFAFVCICGLYEDVIYMLNTEFYREKIYNKKSITFALKYINNCIDELKKPNHRIFKHELLRLEDIKELIVYILQQINEELTKSISQKM